MMLKRHRVTTALTGIVGGALLITGCGAAAPQSAPAPGGAGVAAGGGGGIGTSNCSEADFISSANAVEGESGVFTVTVGNRSAKTCTINGGVPNLQGLDMTNSPIEGLPVEDVPLPNAPKQFTLQPGQVVYFAVGTVPADSGDPNRFTVVGFQSSLPDMSEAQPVHVVDHGNGPIELSAKGLKVSSLVPTFDDLNPGGVH